MERVYDHVIACNSLKGKVIEDFESRPHKAVTIVVERGKVSKECRMSYLDTVKHRRKRLGRRRGRRG